MTSKLAKKVLFSRLQSKWTVTVSHPPSNHTSINTYVVSDSSVIDYFCVADGLLHTAMDMEDRVKAAANNEPENEWASDGEATVFEEYHE